MNKLNRKQYKKDIKEFRQKYGYDGIVGHWVHITNGCFEAIMFVQNQSVIRHKTRHIEYPFDSETYISTSFPYEFKGYYFTTKISGNRFFYRWHSLGEAKAINYNKTMHLDNYSTVKIIPDNEVQMYFDKMFDVYAKECKRMLKLDN